jgi:hypothetical protein
LFFFGKYNFLLILIFLEADLGSLGVKGLNIQNL